MRSSIFLLVFACLMPIVVFRPAVGAYVWAWLGIMNPHRLTYGATMFIPFAQITAILLAVGIILTKNRRAIPVNSITVPQILLVFWMSVTTLTALNPDKAEVFDNWTHMLKLHLLLFASMVVVFERKRIETLIWVIVVSLGFYGVKGGLYTLATAGSGRVWGPPGGVVQGNNELGVALVIVMPLMYYLAQIQTKAWIRHALWISMGLTGLAVLGTHSRGALLAVSAMVVLLGLRSNRPVLVSVVLMVAAAIAITFMPDSWVSRMETISPDRLDNSARTRLLTWQMIWNLALDRPILGAGFNFSSMEMYDRYLPGQMTVAYAPHSIYFQALGEHGFIGLFLYLAVGVGTWRTCGRLIKVAKKNPDFLWVGALGRALQVSIAGFAVGGTFLGLLHFDVPFYLAGLAALAAREVKLADQALERQKIANRQMHGHANGVRGT